MWRAPRRIRGAVRPGAGRAGQVPATIKETGYTAQVVSGKGKAATGTAPLSLQCGVALLDEALAKAQKERKPVVLDFFAQRRAPCQSAILEALGATTTIGNRLALGSTRIGIAAVEVIAGRGRNFFSKMKIYELDPVVNYRV
jgi:hypothetical protein